MQLKCCFVLHNLFFIGLADEVKCEMLLNHMKETKE